MQGGGARLIFSHTQVLAEETHERLAGLGVPMRAPKGPFSSQEPVSLSVWVVFQPGSRSSETQSLPYLASPGGGAPANSLGRRPPPSRCPNAESASPGQAPEPACTALGMALSAGRVRGSGTQRQSP